MWETIPMRKLQKKNVYFLLNFTFHFFRKAVEFFLSHRPHLCLPAYICSLLLTLVPNYQKLHGDVNDILMFLSIKTSKLDTTWISQLTETVGIFEVTRAQKWFLITRLWGGFVKSNKVIRRHAVAQLVEALRYKPEGRGFDFRWCHRNFLLT